MSRWFSRLRTNQRLALVALLLGLLAVFSSPASRASVDPHALTLAAQRGSDRVQPRELANWLIEGRADYRLIDLRDETAFAAYHLPGAENIPFAAIADSGLAPTEKIVLFSDDGTRAGESWVLLKAQRFSAVYVLDRGLDGWKRDVLFPVLKDESSEEVRRENERVKNIATHFGGAPRSTARGTLEGPGAAAGTPLALPKVEAPTMPAGAKKVAPKKKEGC